MPNEPKTAPAPGVTGRSWSRLGIALALAAITLAVFWPATGYDFLNFDDDRYVMGNPAVREGLTVQGVQWAFTSVREDWWLPLLWISYMVDTEIFGTGPFGYHLINILLHALNVALLFWALSRLTGSRWRGAFLAALFAVHPLRVESVAWIAARKDVLSGSFFMLGLIAYARYVERPTEARLWTLPIMMLLGLLSKAIVLIFPFALLLLDYWPLRRAGDPWGAAGWKAWRPLLKEKLLLFYLAGIFIVVNLRTHQAGAYRFPWLTRLGLMFPNYWAYLGKIFWPARLSILYPENDAPNWPLAIAALLGLAAVTLLLVRLRKKCPYLIVGWLWFLLALFPVIRGLRFGLAAYTDRFTYLPSIGLGLGLLWGAAEVLSRRRWTSVVGSALGVVLLAGCLWQTRATLPHWRNSVTVFANAWTGAPEHPVVNNNYGEGLLSMGKSQAALPYLEKAVAGSPKTTPFIANAGLALVLLNRSDEAIARMEKARSDTDPNCPMLNFVLGVAWMEKGEPERAIPCLKRAIAKSPERPTWRMELARAYMEAGHTTAMSNELLSLAQDGRPELSTFEGMCSYYTSLWKNGHGARAWTFFERALTSNSNNFILLNNAAWLLATDPSGAVPQGEALRLATRARELAGEGHATILDTLAVAYAADGQYDQAVTWAEKAHSLAQSNNQTALAFRIADRLRAYRDGKAWGKNGEVRK